MALKYSEVPVVVAPAGRVLGGGAEIVMHGQKVRAAVETYIGLVEVGAGLIPAGGGCKELLARWQTTDAASRGRSRRRATSSRSSRWRRSPPAPTTRMSYGFLRKTDAVTLDRERLLADAKADALALAEAKDARRVAAADAADVPPAGCGRAAACWSRWWMVCGCRARRASTMRWWRASWRMC